MSTAVNNPDGVRASTESQVKDWDRQKLIETIIYLRIENASLQRALHKLKKDGYGAQNHGQGLSLPGESGDTGTSKGVRVLRVLT